MSTKTAIILMGGPCSGKDDRSKDLLDHFGDDATLIIMSEILKQYRTRMAFEVDSRTIGDLMGKGELVPDGDMLLCLSERFASIAEQTDGREFPWRYVILNGTARTLCQTRLQIELLLPRYGINKIDVFHLVCSNGTAWQRLRGRRGTGNRIDDRGGLRVLKRRIDLDRQKTPPIVEYLENRARNLDLNCRYIKVNTDQAPEQVRNEMLSYLGRRNLVTA